MRQALAVAARDLRERALVLVMAVVVSAMPFGIVLSRHATDPKGVILVAGLILSVATTIGIAVVIGASMVGRDLSERRLSFYFSKPISAPAIWFGKLAAAVMTVLATFAIVFVPSEIAAHAVWQAHLGNDPLDLARVVVVAAVSLLLVAHGISTAVRSRSPYIVADLVLAAIAAYIVWLLVVPFVATFALLFAQRMTLAAAVAIPVAIAFAGAWQLSRGRTDIRRSHRELSRAFWVGMAVVIAGLGIYGGTVLDAKPAALTNRIAVASPRGDWFALSGTAAGDYRPTFFVDSRTGRAMQTKASLREGGGIQFTRRGDGALALVPIVDGFHVQRARIRLEDLDRHVSADTGISLPVVSGLQAVVSDDLTRIATVDGHLVSVYDVHSRALLGSARLPFGDMVRMFFVSPQIVRIYAAVFATRQVPSPDMHIFEFDVATRRVQQTGVIPDNTGWFFTTNADGSLLAMPWHGSFRVLDGRTGAPRATIARGKWAQRVTLLSNGGFATVDLTTDAFVRIFDANGALVRDIPIGAASGRLMFGGSVREIVRGRKLLLTIRHGDFPGATDLAVLDMQTGSIDRIERHALAATQFWSIDPRTPDPAPECVISQNGAFWRWNPLTGAKTKIL